jgi:ribosome-binding protein aMBF1 (putative translation factor)
MNLMRLNDMKSNSQLLSEQLRGDPEFRAEWERTALGRAVALAVIRYRAAHELSQRDLAQRLRMKQPQVARLELGEVNPSIDTLMRIASNLQMTIRIEVRPARRPARNVDGRLVATFRADDAELSVAVQ